MASAQNDEVGLLDVTKKGWMQKMFGDITKASVAKQITVGGATGWVAGYLSVKVGKSAAAALGGSLLVMQIAHHQGYISVNWGKLERNIKDAKLKIKSESDKVVPAILEETQNFVQENLFLAGGFTGGFLLGLAS